MRRRKTIIFLDRPYAIEVRREYDFWSFLGDAFMTCATSGIWLIWVFIRERRN